MATEPLRAISSTEKWCRLDDCDIPAAEQLKLMRCCAPRKTATDD
jgi:hypothetical protein